MAYKGKYTPENPRKYKGKIENIIYRSLWERKFMVFCDKNPNVIQWSSEEIIIPYLSIDNKIHKYYVDFWVKIKTKNKIEEYILEIKPKIQCFPPKFKKKNISKQEKKILETWNINKKKWKHAQKYAEKNNIKFKILTEDHLNIK